MILKLTHAEASAMTVNERLSVAGLLPAFDVAVAAEDATCSKSTAVFRSTAQRTAVRVPLYTPKGGNVKVDGRCHCGEVTYEAIVEPDAVAICHCTDCQMLTGSAYRTTVAAARATFVLRSGQPKIYVKTAESGVKRAHSFCPKCGSPIHSAGVLESDFYSLRVGCLRQRAELRPARQAWCDSALPWTLNLQGIPQLRRQ